MDRHLKLYEKYSRKDAFKLLNWNVDESSAMYGYKPKHNTCPIFITYHKNGEVEFSLNYGDKLLNSELLKWYTRSRGNKFFEKIGSIGIYLGYDICVP